MTKRPFNILYLSSFGDFWGGGQISLFQLVKNVDRAAFRPSVMLPHEGDFSEKLQQVGIPYTIMDLPRILNFNAVNTVVALRNLLKVFRRHRIDLVHTDGPRNTFYAGLACKLARRPLVWHVRAFHSDRYDPVLVRLPSRMILVAHALRSRFHWMNGSGKLVTIYNGIDVAQFRNRKALSSVRKQHKIPKESLVIGAIGRIEQLKGQKHLIQACGLLKSQFPDFYLVLAGEVTEPDYLRQCKNLAHDLGIGKRLITPGRLNNIASFLDALDVFVLPSLTEAFSRSLIEAMAAGKAIIATDVGGCAEAVEDHVSGFIVPASHAEALAEKLLALAADANRRQEMGTLASQRAERHFSIQENVTQTETVYREILGERPYGIH